MSDAYEYRKREDPRLARRESKSEHSKLSPKQPSSTAPRADPRLRDHSWQTDQSQTQNSQYNASMQTTYQHLPASMYTEHNQYSTQGYQQQYSTYQANYQTTYNPYQGYDQTQAGYSGTVQPGPPGEEYPRNEWAPAYQSLSQASVHQTSMGQPAIVENNEDHKQEAIAQELKQQKTQMAKQREEYVRKVSVLHRELDLLRIQKQELLADDSSDHDNKHILRENNKLQIEIQNKMKTICNVIDMLTNIIGDHHTVTELQEQYKQEESPKQQRREKSKKSVSTDINDSDSKYCYVYYDPELHWCRICDVFPKSAKEYLLHLHSKEHRQITQERNMVDTPWHRLPVEPEISSCEGAAKKRMPIKGNNFLISATAWYCKLCDAWVGDLHCASQHLKSKNHNYNYTNFVEQNPHWEIEWLRDRDKALTRITKQTRSDSDDSDNHDSKKLKKLALFDNKRDRKKKKHAKKRKKHFIDSSSSSSSTYSSSDDDNNDKSKSIRVAMRNKMKLQAQMIMNEDVGGKWEVLDRIAEKHKEISEMGKESGSEDNLINQWMTINEPQEKDKRLFDNLKDRMKQKQEAEKARLAEIDIKRLEKEKKEQELQEQKEKEQQEIREQEEERRRQQEELDRQREREREQIKFKTREKYKKPSKSPEKASASSPSNDFKKQERSSNRHYRSHHNENGRHSSDRRRSSSYDKKDSPESKRSSHRHNDKDSERNSDYSKKEKRYRGSSSYKKPHFIGRMPLFKNKKSEEKIEKEIKKEDYDIPRQSRFQPGHLARAFIPEPDVVCFPKLSSIPPLMLPPPPVVVPEAPQISENLTLQTPPPPVINDEEKNSEIETNDDISDIPPAPIISEETHNIMPSEDLTQEEISQIYGDPTQSGMDSMMQYPYNMDYNAMMYSQMYDYSQDVPVDDIQSESEQIPIEHTMPLQPPPLPPDDPSEDLAMLGISVDDMAAQMF